MLKTCQLIVPLVIAFLLVATQTVDADKKHSKKYSKETNEPHYQQIANEKYEPEIRNLQRPFRLAKLNLIWAKAQNRLTESKIKSLYMELKIHDKEEIAWKQLNSQHKDKDGLKENELRQKLIGIMSSYDLLEHFEDTQDKEKTKPYKKFHDPEERHKNKSLFKDKN
ncbi:GH14080 [Drosophila grimshawi]|uniref:GH14080 n=1 Tax=Drosophila grimshawi TaxID=7222 RepID=B4JY57_DROGR|nr:GH14080 [Drosophila grimshawi]